MIPANYRIAIVEDDPDLCQGWIELFSILGYSSRGYHTLADLLSDPGYLSGCSLVITDYYLPDSNGIELLRQVREKYGNIPGILLTGSRETAVSEAARMVGNCSIVLKPVNIDDFERIVQRVLMSAAA